MQRLKAVNVIPRFRLWHPSSRSAAVVAAVGLGLGISLASCSGTTNSGPGPSPPGTPVVNDAVLTGPKVVAPGATAQFVLTARLSNGTEQDVTGQAVWSSTDTSRLRVTSGLVTGQATGDATLSARYTPAGRPTLTRTTEVLVLPDGTFRVLGRVTEPVDVPVTSASVRVSSGSGAGQSAFTAPDGRFRLYGLNGLTRIEVRKTGYRDDSQEILITAQDQPVDLELRPPTSIEPVEGLYTLTVAASTRCRDALPEVARVRTYGASIARAGRDLTVTLSGATLVGTATQFFGRLEPGGTVLFPYNYYYSSGVFINERIDANGLYISGGVTAQLSGDVIAGRLNGLFDLRAIAGNLSGARCADIDHQFQLTRLR